MAGGTAVFVGSLTKSKSGPRLTGSIGLVSRYSGSDQLYRYRQHDHGRDQGSRCGHLLVKTALGELSAGRFHVAVGLRRALSHLFDGTRDARTTRASAIAVTYNYKSSELCIGSIQL
jgi:hypothetical protein